MKKNIKKIMFFLSLLGIIHSQNAREYCDQNWDTSCRDVRRKDFQQQGRQQDLEEQDVQHHEMRHAPRVTAEPLATIGRSAEKGLQVKENVSPLSKAYDSSDPLRFLEISADTETALDEINFWVHQISEHALFLHLGLEDKKLKKEALNLHQQFEKFLMKLENGTAHHDFLNTILPLLKKQRAFERKLAKLLDSGKWIGWLFPIYVNHITLELDYLVDKLNGIKYSPEDEIKFWNRINGEHAGLDSHLLDPSEKEKIKKADAFSRKFQEIPQTEYDMFVKISLEGSKELNKFHREAKSAGKAAIKSIIHPVLLEHEIREGERSVKTLQALERKNGKSTQQSQSSDMQTIKDTQNKNTPAKQ